MKIASYGTVLVLGLMAACQSPSGDQQKQDGMLAKKDSASAEVQLPETDSSKLIIPGKQAGSIYLGQYMEKVSEILGRRDAGDAAMGSALGIWYAGKDKTQKKNPTVVFSSYRDSNMVIKAVKQVSVAAPEFRTSEGIRTGSRLAELMKVYPSLKKTETYINKQKDSVFIYDSITEGIAFDLQHDTCTAITIHMKNRPANSLYLPVHPEWKKI